MTSLFEIDDRDELMIVKNFFCEFDGILFPGCIGYVLDRTGYGNEYAMCEFPEDIEDGEAPFVGVKFRMFGGDEKVISEETFKAVLLEACRRFVRREPQHLKQIGDILSQRGLVI